MGYRVDEADQSRWSLKRVGGILLGILAFVVAKEITKEGIHFARQKTASNTQVEQALESDPRFGSAFAEFKKDFPSDYERISTNAAALIRSGATPAELNQNGYSGMHDFVRSHMPQIVSASDETLASLAASQSTVADALAAEDQYACAEFGDSGLQPGTQLSDGTLQRIAEITRLMIVAAHEGGVAPIQRKTDDVSKEDSLALIDALRRHGLTDEKIKLFADGMQGASVQDKCQIGVALYDSVAELPKPLSARLTAFFLAQSVAQQQPAS